MSSRTQDTTIKLTDGSTIEIAGVLEVRHDPGDPFVVLRTDSEWHWYRQLEIQSMRPCEPAVTAIPTSDLQWQTERWWSVDSDGNCRDYFETQEQATAGAAMTPGDTVAREETATLARLVPVE